MPSSKECFSEPSGVQQGGSTSDEHQEKEVPVLRGFKYDYHKKRYFRTIPGMPDNNFNENSSDSSRPKRTKYDSDGIWLADEVKRDRDLTLQNAQLLGLGMHSFRPGFMHREIVGRAYRFLNKIVETNTESCRKVSLRHSAEPYLKFDVNLNSPSPELLFISKDKLMSGTLDLQANSLVSNFRGIDSSSDEFLNNIQILDGRICSASRSVAFGVQASDDVSAIYRKDAGVSRLLCYPSYRYCRQSAVKANGDFAAAFRDKSSDELVILRSNPSNFLIDLLHRGPKFAECPVSCLEFSPRDENNLYIGTTVGDVQLNDLRDPRVSVVLPKSSWKEAGQDYKCRITSLRCLNGRNSFITTISTAPSPSSKMHLWDMRSIQAPAVSFEDTAFPSHENGAPISISSDDSLAVVSDPGGATRIFDINTGNMLVRIPEIDMVAVNETRLPTVAHFTDIFGGISGQRRLLLCSLGSVTTNLTVHDLSERR